MIPGGKRDEDESEHQALVREIDEELGISLRVDTLKYVGVFEGPADDQPEGVRVRLSCYEADFIGKPAPQAEVEELVWLGYQDLRLVATTDRLIFELLFQQERIQ